jgi:DNA polymerase III delta prime subunit
MYYNKQKLKYFITNKNMNMNEPFLKRYQPKKYRDLAIGKEFIQLLRSLISMDNLNVLFIGNNGCGKTTIINATIREYYETDKIPSHNVLYINNLQEQGIQYHRTELRTFCQTSSTISGKKKFIVMDDIDLINSQSQQVFRNVIDKFSHNVNFISSCSNTQKVIDSIQSRCILVKIKPISKQYLKKIYDKIEKKENLNISKEARDFILTICNNSIRVLINYMEKFNLINEEITIKEAKSICTNISFYEFESFTTKWYVNKDYSSALKQIYIIFDKGYSVMDILDCYFTFIKMTDMLDEMLKYKIIKLICKYITIFNTVHESEIELTLFTYDLINTVESI